MFAKSKTRESTLEQITESLSEATTAKPCAYKDCRNTIPTAHQFPYCDVCRVLMTRNALTVLQDPFSPQPISQHVKAQLHTELLTSLTGEEILRFIIRQEETYLAVKGYIKLHKIGEATPRVAKTVQERIDEIRLAQDTHSVRATVQKKRAKKVATNQDKLLKLLGGDTDDDIGTRADKAAKVKQLLGNLDLSDL